MLPSEQLRQEQNEAIQIEKERTAKKRAEPKALPAAPTTTDGREPDLTGGVDVDAVRFPANVMMANSKSHFAVGNEYSNSMTVSGPVTRVVLMPAGYCYGSVRTATGVRWVVVMPTGMTAELSQ
jgi:hypothetical protein